MTRPTPPRPPRRVDARDAAEAVFRPVAKVPEPAPKTIAVPGAREVVSLRLDQDVLAHFQDGGVGWQDRINQTLRQAIGL